jgi:hypothetical protein
MDYVYDTDYDFDLNDIYFIIQNMDSGLENIKDTKKENIVTVNTEDEHEYITEEDTEEEPGYSMTEETLETDNQTSNDNANNTNELRKTKVTSLTLNNQTESISSTLSIIAEKTEHTTRRNVNRQNFNNTTHDSLEVLNSNTNNIMKAEATIDTTAHNTITEAIVDYDTTSRETEHDLTVSQSENVVEQITTASSFNIKIETNGTQNVAKLNKIEHVKENGAHLNENQTDLGSNAFKKVNKTRIK